MTMTTYLITAVTGGALAGGYGYGIVSCRRDRETWDFCLTWPFWYGLLAVAAVWLYLGGVAHWWITRRDARRDGGVAQLTKDGGGPYETRVNVPPGLRRGVRVGGSIAAGVAVLAPVCWGLAGLLS